MYLSQLQLAAHFCLNHMMDIKEMEEEKELGVRGAICEVDLDCFSRLLNLFFLNESQTR